MAKGMPKRADEMQSLEGGIGSGGGGRSSASRMVENAAGPGLLVGSGAAGYADYKMSKAKQQEDREAAAELKRESRGIQKTETDRAREEADEMSRQKKNDAAYNRSVTSEGMAKGGMTASSRADGCCQRGKTRGKMV